MNANRSSNASKQTKISFFLTLVIFLVWALLAIGLIVLLDSYLSGIQQKTFSPRNPFQLDFSYSIETLKDLWIILVGILLFGSLINAIISQWKLPSKVLLGLIVLISITLSIFALIVSLQECEGLSCLGIGYAVWLAEGSLIMTAGTIPPLSASILNLANPFLRKKFWLIGITTIIFTSVLWFTATAGLRAEFSKRIDVKQTDLEKVFKDPTFPVYEPIYLPPQITKLVTEDVDEIRAPASMPGSPRYWEVKWGGSVNYLRTYLNGQISDFKLTQTKLYQPITIKEFLKNDLDALHKIQQEKEDRQDPWNYQNIEKLFIGDSPAIFVSYRNSPSIWIYKDNMRIVIDGSGKVPREELIKIAESLERMN